MEAAKLPNQNQKRIAEQSKRKPPLAYVSTRHFVLF
jgi:hypothetical protein